MKAPRLDISETSDSAATHKCLNKLIVERREIDEERFGPAVYALMRR